MDETPQVEVTYRITPEQLLDWFFVFDCSVKAHQLKFKDLVELIKEGDQQKLEDHFNALSRVYYYGPLTQE